MSQIKWNDNLSLEAKFTAFPYQLEAFSAVKDLDYCAIFHEQGLGKTKIAIDLALYWIANKNIDCVMIVTKKQLVNNWINEISSHTFIKPKVMDSNKGNNYRVMNSASRIIVTNFETVVSEQERMELFLKSRDVAIVIDESTKLKNPDAKLTKVFFDLSKLFKIRSIMTGTPVANRPYDIWAQIYFLDGGKSLGDDFYEFKKNTDLSNKLASNKDARRDFEDSVGSIYSSIASFTVRETKRTCGIKLPQKIYLRIEAEFEERQANLYRSIISDLSVEIKRNGSVYLDDDTEALKRLLRLNQVASNPKLIDESYNSESGKEKALSKLLLDIYNRGEKCIVWSCYIENIDYFAEKYGEYNPRKIHGSMTIEERNKSVDVFKNDPACKVLFATPQAAKEGLTLTVANNAIFYDRTFNLDDYLQAQDRIHRISQEKECNIYNIVIENSIDRWIDSLLSAKQYAAFLAQGDIDRNDYRNEIDYSYGQIIKEILEEGKLLDG